MTRIEYIKLFGPYMIEALKGKKLFPSVMMAQTLLERAGKDGVPEGSLLASKYNNHFGTKADAFRESGKVALRTNGFIKGERFTVKQLFRVYESVQQSFDDRIQFLLRNTAYAKGGVFNAVSAADQAELLQCCGYATDRSCASKLIALIKRLGLSDLDSGIFSPQRRKDARMYNLICIVSASLRPHGENCIFLNQKKPTNIS
ncbi:MAG: glucosaminidase domain-containing protein [Chryseolinea sp.]